MEKMKRDKKKKKDKEELIVALLMEKSKTIVVKKKDEAKHNFLYEYGKQWRPLFRVTGEMKLNV